jgi:hypothetical protein
MIKRGIDCRSDQPAGQQLIQLDIDEWIALTNSVPNDASQGAYMS